MTKLLLPQKSFGVAKRVLGHELVVKTAREMGYETYEKCCSMDNDFRKKWPSRESYVEKALPLIIPQARATLTDLMTQTQDENLKEKIYQALCLDSQFVDRIV